MCVPFASVLRRGRLRSPSLRALEIVDPSRLPGKDHGTKISLSVLPGLNLTALLAGMVISSPVWGLRPFLSFLSWTENVPKPVKVSLPSLTRDSSMLPRQAFKARSEPALLMSVFSETFLIRSDLFIVPSLLLRVNIYKISVLDVVTLLQPYLALGDEFLHRGPHPPGRIQLHAQKSLIYPDGIHSHSPLVSRYTVKAIQPDMTVSLQTDIQP